MPLQYLNAAAPFGNADNISDFHNLTIDSDSVGYSYAERSTSQISGETDDYTSTTINNNAMNSQEK